MKFVELLKSNGMDEEQVKAVQEKMKEEGIYLSKEENIDERYDKLKKQHDDLKNDLEQSNNTIEDLKKHTKDDEESQKIIDQYKADLEAEREGRAADNKNHQIDLALNKFGAKNNKAVRSLLDLDKISVDDEGLKGLDEQLKSLKESDDYLFQEENEGEVPKFITDDDPSQQDNSVDAFDAVAQKYE